MNHHSIKVTIIYLIHTFQNFLQYLAIEPHTVAIKGRADGDGGGGAEVFGIKSDADAIVNGKD